MLQFVFLFRIILVYYEASIQARQWELMLFHTMKGPSKQLIEDQIGNKPLASSVILVKYDVYLFIYLSISFRVLLLYCFVLWARQVAETGG
jgi:hypothetical protein